MGTCTECGSPSATDTCEGCAEPIEWSAALAMIYHPPYAEFGAQYGPRTAGAAHRELVEFCTERFGAVGSPATWDATEEPRGVARAAKQEAPRKDAGIFEARIAMLAPAMAKRQLAASMLFWRSRMSVGRICKHMGVKESTVREWIQRTRKDLAAGH